MANKYRLAVIGSRTFTDRERLYKILDANIDKIEMIVSGGAKGADTIVNEWCKDRGMSILIHYPKWYDMQGNFNRAAGMRRNYLIADSANKILAFWDGESTGTKGMLEICKQKGKSVKLITFTPEKKEPSE